MVLLGWHGKQELLDLGERIGYVNTGLRDEEIGHCLRKIKLSISNDWSRLSAQADRKCSICQVSLLVNKLSHRSSFFFRFSNRLCICSRTYKYLYVFIKYACENRRNLKQMMIWVSWTVDMVSTQNA